MHEEVCVAAIHYLHVLYGNLVFFSDSKLGLLGLCTGKLNAIVMVTKS